MSNDNHNSALEAGVGVSLGVVALASIAVNRCKSKVLKAYTVMSVLWRKRVIGMTSRNGRADRKHRRPFIGQLKAVLMEREKKDIRAESEGHPDKPLTGPVGSDECGFPFRS